MSHKELSKLIPKQLEIKSGSLRIDSFARIGAKRFEDIFFELNATNLDFRYFDNNFSVPKLISFLIGMEEMSGHATHILISNFKI